MKKSHFQITWKEWVIALLILVMGFFFSTKTWLLWLDTLNPLVGMLVYYLILGLAFGVLALIGLKVFNTKIKNILQVLGLLMVWFAFAVPIGFSSNYVQYITKGNFEGASVVYFQCEDGVMWWLFYDVIGIHSILIARILAFMVMPFLIALLGLLLVKEGDIIL